MTDILGRRGDYNDNDTSLLFFFLLLVIIFSNSWGFGRRY